MYKLPKPENRTNRRHMPSKKIYQLQSHMSDFPQDSKHIKKWCFANTMEEADAYFRDSGIKGSFFLTEKSTNRIIVVNY